MPRVLRLGPGILVAALFVVAGCSGADTTAPVADPVTSVAPSPAPSSSALSSSAPAGPTSAISAAPSPTPAVPTSASASPPSPTSSASSTPRPTASTTAPTAPQTSTYAQSVSLRGSALSYTRLRWYWGKAAKARCKAKHVKAEFEWCNDYYYENTHQLGRSPMATDAKIRLLDDDGTLHDGTSAELATSIQTGTWSYYRLWTAGGRIVKLEQVFTP